jgi:hypothetical protein
MILEHLYGSWARREEKRTSDIDIAIWCEHELPAGMLTNIRFAFEESTIPYRVDVVDWSRLDQPIKDKVLSEGIIWKDYKNG